MSRTELFLDGEPLAESSVKFTVDLGEDWLARAERAVREAERLEAQAEDQVSRGKAESRTSHRAMRDELLLAQAEATIAVAKALRDQQPWSPILAGAKGDQADEGWNEFVPVTVVGVRDSLSRREDFAKWLLEHGIAPDLTIEIINIGDRFALVKQIKVDVGGRSEFGDDGPIMAEPFAVAIRRPMPQGPRLEGEE